jgi:hypothetical protein
MIVVVNEFCQGSWSRDGGVTFVPLPCQIMPDPLTGILVPHFILPQPVTPGDLIVNEPDGTLTDCLRFPQDPAGGPTRLMSFWSDVDDDPDGAPSDVGLPPFFQANQAVTDEVGVPEVFDYFLYPAGLALYIGISDFGHPGDSPAPGKSRVTAPLAIKPAPVQSK